MSTDSVPTFLHHHLDAYRVSLELAAAAKKLADSIPRSYRTVADQLLRKAISHVALIAEGANRLGAGEKRAKFSMARGECGENAAAAELAAVLGLVGQDEAQQVMRLAGRIGAMTTRLIQRFS